MVAKLVKLTLSALDAPVLSPREMQKLLGLWTWPALLRRSILSVFDYVYELANATRPFSPRSLSSEQRQELTQILALLQLIFANLTLPFSNRAHCSDASPSGGGVVYADFDGGGLTQFISSTSETKATRGWQSKLT